MLVICRQTVLVVYIWVVILGGVSGHTRAPLASHVRPRLPLNSHCPTHGYPYSVKAYAQYVAQHPLLQPGITERMAAEDPSWFSQSLTEFMFTTGQYAADYLSKVAPIDGQRPFQLHLDCASPKYGSILSGKPRDTPAKVVWGSRFNFETPLLLFRFHTYKDLVDYHFISETGRADHSMLPKPMLFARVMEHFTEFLPQIVHHVVDGTSYQKPVNWSETPAGLDKDEWSHEGVHFDSITERFLPAFKDLPDDSIVLHGDIDENPDEDFLFHLKHCKLKEGVTFPIRSNAVMWLYDYRYVFKGGMDTANPFSFRFPLFWTLGYIRQHSTGFNWRVSPSTSPQPSSPGGDHFSYMLFPPSLYMKLVSMAESGAGRFFSSERVRRIHQELQERRDTAGPWGLRQVTHPDCLVQHYPEYKDIALKLPWLMAQNPQQFAFFIPCEPAAYDRDNALQSVLQDCQRLFAQ